MSSLNDNFGAWLREVIPSFTGEERDNRLALIRQFALTVPQEDIVALVLLFYQSKTDGLFADRLRAAIRVDVDPGFSEKNDAELAIFAAGILYELLERGGLIASTVALALTCAEFGPLGETPRVEQAIRLAADFLAEEGARIRECSVKVPSLENMLNTALQPAADEESAEEDDTAAATEEELEVSEQLERIVKALGKYGTAVNQALGLVESRRAEESNILYWLLSGRRRIGDSLLKQIKKQGAVIAIALELADLTSQVPGPASASPILLSLLEQCKDSVTEVSVEDCVGSVGHDDGSRYVSISKTLHPLITPMIYALEKAKENGWQKGWQNAFEVQTKLDPSKKRPALEITEQVYREALLSRILGAK
jgi:GTPase-associated system helical domain